MSLECQTLHPQRSVYAIRHQVNANCREARRLNSLSLIHTCSCMCAHAHTLIIYQKHLPWLERDFIFICISLLFPPLKLWNDLLLKPETVLSVNCGEMGDMFLHNLHSIELNGILQFCSSLPWAMAVEGSILLIDWCQIKMIAKSHHNFITILSVERQWYEGEQFCWDDLLVTTYKCWNYREWLCWVEVGIRKFSR